MNVCFSMIIKSFGDKLKKFICLIVLFTIFYSQKSFSETMKGFESKSDIRAGFFTKYGYPFSLDKNFSGITPLSFLEVGFQAENLLHGTSTISFSYFNNVRFFNPIDYKRNLYEIAIENTTNMTKSCFEINLTSPINYKYYEGLEYGWIMGAYFQNVAFNTTVSGNTQTGTGLVAGMYNRYMDFYPYNISSSLKFLLGNFYDNARTYQSNSISSTIKIGYEANLNFEYYLSRNYLLSLGVNTNNFDFFNFSPVKATIKKDTKTFDLADPYFNFSENMFYPNLRLSFFF